MEGGNFNVGLIFMMCKERSTRMRCQKSGHEKQEWNLSPYKKPTKNKSTMTFEKTPYTTRLIQKINNGHATIHKKYLGLRSKV